MLEISFGIID